VGELGKGVLVICVDLQGGWWNKMVMWFGSVYSTELVGEENSNGKLLGWDVIENRGVWTPYLSRLLARRVP